MAATARGLGSGVPGIPGDGLDCAVRTIRKSRPIMGCLRLLRSYPSR